MIWRALSFSHFWIALGASATAWLTWNGTDYGTIDTPQHLAVVIWVGLCTGCGYTVQRAIKHQRTPAAMPPERRRYWDRHALSMLTVWGSLWLLFTWSQWKLMAWELSPLLAVGPPLVLASLAYAMAPGLPGGLRSVIWLKTPLIAAVWATACTLHPNVTWDPVLWGQRFLLIAGLSLPIDIRDMGVDKDHIPTWPMVLGPRSCLRWAQGLLVLAGLLPWAHAASWWAIGEDLAAATPLVMCLQAWGAAWWLRPSRALPLLTSTEEWEKEKAAGWVLDGVLVWPLLWCFLMMR